MLSGVRENRELLSRSRYRTVGEMVVRDEKFASSKRNKAGEYARTHSRAALASEVREIFRAQRRWGNVRAGSDLENVQGDERDVIFISTTYGPERAGVDKVAQRFGPINSDLGWRRLNVIATRAKQRVEVFTSMRPYHILVGGEARRGVRALRDYLKYADTGGYSARGHATGWAPENDFEEVVGRSIEELGFEIEPQVGAEGFFIDIGVRHPDRPGEFLVAVECDGASYHSARSVRDRDRLRQEILEDKGWFIHRIWSTSWFHARSAEIDRLSRMLQSRLEEARSVSRPAAVEPRVDDYESPSWLDADDLQEEDEAESLTTALERFWDQNLKPQFPDKTKSILSSEMVEFLVRVRM